MTFEKKDTVKIIFAMVLAMSLGIAVALCSVAFSGRKDTEAVVSLPDIKVYIRGEIKNPGLYEIGADIRLCELIEKAGGTTENASLDMLNLAAILIDGTTVTVPSVPSGESESPASVQTAVGVEPEVDTLPEEAYRAQEHYTTEVQPAAQQQSEATQPSQPEPERVEKITSGTININTAGKEELMQLPGVGEATAAKIISYRDSNGGFESIEEIMNVSGIGEKKFESMKPFIAVE